jgi:hypothetical protein
LALDLRRMKTDLQKSGPGGTPGPEDQLRRATLAALLLIILIFVLVLPSGIPL